jgi:1,4-dihydroxy-6-naphthoate synthase
MARRVTIGFSSCPNDTFMFHALVSGAVRIDDIGPTGPEGGVELDVVMEDIEALNRRAAAPNGGRLGVTKLSVSAFGRAADRYAILGAGAALGRGCGPLVVHRRDGGQLGDLAGARVAIPGVQTTAWLLLRMFGPEVVPVPMRFDEVMPAVAAGDVEAGLVIHESRFTYPDHGLVALADLGELWEADTGGPLPLGVIAIDRELLPLAPAIEDGIRRSVQAAWADPDASRGYVRAHAQELSEDVCARHIALYVNAWSADLGPDGRTAIETMLARGRDLGLLPDSPLPLFA